MAKSKSLTVLTVVSSIFALQACTEGALDGFIPPDEATASAEGINLPVISLAAANPNGTETTIPVTPSIISNYIVNNISILPISTSPLPSDEELDANIPPVTDFSEVTDPAPETDPSEVPDTAPETDSSEVTGIASDTDPSEVTDIAADTDPYEVTDTASETDYSEVIDSSTETDNVIVNSVGYSPLLQAPAKRQLVPYGSRIEFAWSIPVALFGTVTGFDIAIANTSEGVVSYRDNVVAISSCNIAGLCIHEINSADLPIPEGENIWSVSSTGSNVGFNIAEATFTLDKDPEEQTVNGLSLLSPGPGYNADSSSVEFAWEDPSNLNAVYDLHIYSDAARTQKVTGTFGVLFDTSGIGTATSHTFTDDPSDGATRYGLLWQWADAAYDPDSRQEILFEYAAHTKNNTKVVSPATVAHYDAIKTDIDDMFSRYKTFGIFSNSPAESQDGYNSYTVWCAAATMGRITGDTSYLDKAIEGINYWIDSGADLQGNEYLTWWGVNSFRYYNVDHHEWRAAAGIADVVLEMQRSGYEGASGTKMKFTNFLKRNVWEKWAPGHTLASPTGSWLSNRGEKGTWFTGRWAMVAMALDQAQAIGDIPASGQYVQYLEDPAYSFSMFFKTYNTEFYNSARAIPWWTNRQDYSNPKPDTEHAGDIIWSVMRAKQLGYNPDGRMATLMANLENHINQAWFVDADGWTPNTDGTGVLNDFPSSSAQGMGLTGIISPTIRDRWVDFYLYGIPASNNQERRAVQMAAGILAALSGETL